MLLHMRRSEGPYLFHVGSCVIQWGGRRRWRARAECGVTKAHPRDDAVVLPRADQDGK